MNDNNAGNTSGLLGLVTQFLQAVSIVSTSPTPAPEPVTTAPEGVTPIASIDLSTRGFMEAEWVGGYFVTLQVDNLGSCLLSVSSPPVNYRGYYDLSRVPHNKKIALVHDEGGLVPVTITRMKHPQNYSVVRVEIWASGLETLPRLAPYMRNPFK